MNFNFGSTASNTNTGFAFGATNSNAGLGSKPTGSTTPAVGFSFGNTTTPTQSTGFSLGGATNTSGQSGGFGFGSNPTGAATSTGTGFGFGTNTTTNTTAPTTGFGFGNNTLSFGSTTTTTANKSPFGGSTNTTTTPSGGFGFANNSLSFGNNTTANKPTGLNLFGSPNTTNTAAANPSQGFGAFNFGSKLATNNPPNAPNSAFNNTGFGAAPVQLANQANVGHQSAVAEAIEKLLRAYAPLKDAEGNYQSKGDGRKNDECHFKTVILTQKPSHHRVGSTNISTSSASDHHLLYGALLEEAEKDNIDPSNYIPTEEIGVEALKSRFENQMKEMNNMGDYVIKIKELMKTIYEANQQLQHRILLLKMKQTPLNQKLLLILRKIEVLRCHGNPLQPTEKLFQQRVIQTMQDIEVPTKKLEDISVHLALQVQPRDLYQEDIKEEDLTILINALKRQHEGLEYLMEMLRKDTRDLNIMKSELSHWN
mmetsp:Transcript_21248/g.23077  ORF Transcript_21248/g.23077 Transcript_21248/m.23077 type:complete len:482 (-) Transcript_21248:6652-8097(-)|eukprot:gene982-1042_t